MDGRREKVNATTLTKRSEADEEERETNYGLLQCPICKDAR